MCCYPMLFETPLIPNDRLMIYATPIAFDVAMPQVYFHIFAILVYFS